MTSAAPSPAAPADEDLLEKNRRIDERLWSGASLVEPDRFNTWPLVQSLLPSGARRLEVAPGLRPRLPIEGTQFVDISAPALEAAGRGARVTLGEVTALPFPAATFDLVCALDIIEHVDDDDSALAEISRVARGGATAAVDAVASVAVDAVRRLRRPQAPLRADELLAKLTQHHLMIERSAVFGMQPQSSRLLDGACGG